MKISGKLWLTKEEWVRSIGPIWRGGIIGFIIGVLPGAGGTIASKNDGFTKCITPATVMNTPTRIASGSRARTEAVTVGEVTR